MELERQNFSKDWSLLQMQKAEWNHKCMYVCVFAVVHWSIYTISEKLNIVNQRYC